MLIQNALQLGVWYVYIHFPLSKLETQHLTCILLRLILGNIHIYNYMHKIVIRGVEGGGQKRCLGNKHGFINKLPITKMPDRSGFNHYFKEGHTCSKNKSLQTSVPPLCVCKL